MGGSATESRGRWSKRKGRCLVGYECGFGRGRDGGIEGEQTRLSMQSMFTNERESKAEE